MNNMVYQSVLERLPEFALCDYWHESSWIAAFVKEIHACLQVRFLDAFGDNLPLFSRIKSDI